MTAFKIGKEEQTEQDFLEVCSSFPEYWSFEEMNCKRLKRRCLEEYLPEPIQ